MLQEIRESLASRRVRLWLLNALFLASALAYIGMYVNSPMCLIPGGMHDDGFFILRGVSLADGNWMGAYDQYTLIKGAGYPLFLAVISVVRVPAPLAHALFTVAAIWLLSFLTQKISRSLMLAAAVFEVTLWNLGPEMSRIVRDAIYHAQFMVCFAGLVLAFLASGRRRALMMALSGLCFGWLWITREEGTILLPTFLLIWGYFGYSYFQRAQRRELGLLAALFVGGATLLPLFTAARNWSRYREFEMVDTQGDFAGAISALESIDQPNEKPFMAISRAVRDKAYAVSPTFARVRPYLDEPGAPRVVGWKAASCTYIPTSCGDYGVGWFMWAFRDAAALDGDFANAKKSSDFFHAVHNEITAACNNGKLTCHHSPIPFVPHMVTGEVGTFETSFATLVKMLLFVAPPPSEVGPSVGTPDQINQAAGFTNVNSFVPTAQGVGPPAIIGARFATIAMKWRRFFLRVYAIILPILLPLGLAAFLGACGLAVLRRRFPLYLMVAMAAWITVFIRLFTLALIDATSFPALSNQYVSLAFPMSCFAALLSCYAVTMMPKLQRQAPRNRLKEFRGVGGAPLEMTPQSEPSVAQGAGTTH